MSLAACACALLLAACPAARAESESAEYQVYPLKYKAAAEVEKILGDMLANSGPAVHLVADAKANQILLRGPEKAQQIARELIDSIDQPAARARLSAKAAATLRTYAVEKGRLAGTVDRLRLAYAGRDEVRVAAEAQSSRLFVLAPPAVHEEIARQFGAAVLPEGEGRRAPSSPETRIPAREEAERGPPEEYFGLKRLRAEQIETRLRELFGPRLAALDSGRRGIAEYHYVDGRGRRIELSFDHPRNGVLASGHPALVRQFGRLVRALDLPEEDDASVRIVPIRNADPEKIRQAVEAYRTGTREEGSRPKPDDRGALVPNQGIQLVSYLLQQGEPAGGAAGGAKSSESRPETLRESRPGQVPGKPGAKLTPEEEEDLRRRLRQPGSDVEMEILPDLDAIILRGRDREVKELQRLINEIERLSAETEPAIDIYYLRHVGGEALAAIIKQVNEDFLGGRQGRVTIVPLVKPNALLLIGWGEAVKAAKELIARLDQPVAPAGEHRVFRLRNAVAATVATTVTQFFAGRNRTAGGLGPQVAVTADPSTNSIIVHASPRDLAEVELLLERLDVGDTDAVLQTRIFRLFNTLAGDVAATLQAAIGTRAAVPQKNRRPWSSSPSIRRGSGWSSPVCSTTSGSPPIRG